MNVGDDGYRGRAPHLAEDARGTAEKFFNDLFANRDENFGNARDVRNLFEDMVVRQANRLSAAEGEPDKDALMTITEADFLPEPEPEPEAEA